MSYRRSLEIAVEWVLDMVGKVFGLVRSRRRVR